RKQHCHDNAHSHFKQHVLNKSIIYLSTIVTSEYLIKHSAQEIDFPNMRVQNYDYVSSLKTAEIAKKVFELKKSGVVLDGSRTIIKNDVMILSHAEHLKVDFFLSGDNRLEKLHKTLKDEG